MVANALLEDVFCSRIRIRILKILNQLGQLNISGIAHRLGINYNAAITNLRILEDNGIVQIRPCGRARFYRLSDSSQTRAIKGVLEIWEATDDRELS